MFLCLDSRRPFSLLSTHSFAKNTSFDHLILNTSEQEAISNAYLFLIGRQGDTNFGASSQADFILNHFLSNLLKFPQLSSQILHFFSVRLAGWNNKNHPVTTYTQHLGHDRAFGHMVKTLKNYQYWRQRRL